MIEPSEARDICLARTHREAAETLTRHGVDVHALGALLYSTADERERTRREVVDLTDNWGRRTEMAVYVPEQRSSDRLGVIVGLHGVGGSGVELEPQLRHLADACGAVLLCPTARQSVSGQNNFDLAGIFGSRFRGPRWTFERGDFPLRALRWARERLCIDPDRCALVGTSMGGIATWNISARHWDSWSMAAPINGAPSIWEMFGPDRTTRQLLTNLLNLPLTVIHGSRDDQIPASLDERAVARLRRLGHQRLELVTVPDGEHRLSTMPFAPGTLHFHAVVRCYRSSRRAIWPSRVVHRARRHEDGRAHWVAMDQIVPGRTGVVDARVTGRARLDIHAVHVSKLRLFLCDRLVDPGRVLVVVNGESQEVEFAPSVADMVLTYAESGGDPGLMAQMVTDLEVSADASEEVSDADARRDAQATSGAWGGAGGAVRA